MKSLPSKLPGVWLLRLATMLLASGFVANADEGAGKLPNIVVILFDDMGYGEPTCYRPESRFKTPTLDRLAREGMRFTDAHSAAAVCTPTRYGLLTGRYPMRIGQYGVLQTYSRPIIEKNRLTIGTLLKRRGYDTAAIGKWHLGMTWPGDAPALAKDNPPVGTPPADGPTTRGFDYFCGYTHSANIGMIVEQDRVSANLEERDVQPYLLKKTLAHLDARAAAGGPFFLYLPISPPHLPIVPAKEFQGKSGAKDYGDWLYQADQVVQSVLDALDRHKLADDTLVIVTSDNGAAHRVYEPLRDCKTSIYEGGHRVPFLARWPGRIKPGAVCRETICLNDLLATCAEILGETLPSDAGEDSVSILPLLLGKARGPTREATVHQSHAGDLAIREGPWKLVITRDRHQELYNLRDDIGETRNLASREAEVVDRLSKRLRRYVDDGRSTAGPPLRNSVRIELDPPPKPSEKAKAKAKAKAKSKANAKKKAAVDTEGPRDEFPRPEITKGST